MKVFGIEDTRSGGQSFLVSAIRPSPLGRLPEVVLLGAFGLLFIALAFINPLSGSSWVPLFYWMGLLLLILPVAYRLSSLAVSKK